MSTPSLLPDPGPSAAPMQVMRGGAAGEELAPVLKDVEAGPTAAVEESVAVVPTAPTPGDGGFSTDEILELQRYQLHPGGVIDKDIDYATKQEFLKQIKNPSRCRRTTGDTVILGKDCWAIVKVIRALLRAKIKSTNRTNSGITPAPGPAVPEPAVPEPAVPEPAVPGPAVPGPAPAVPGPAPAPEPAVPGPVPGPAPGPDVPGPTPEPAVPGPAPGPDVPGPTPEPAVPGPAPAVPEPAVPEPAISSAETCSQEGPSPCQRATGGCTDSDGNPAPCVRAGSAGPTAAEPAQLPADVIDTAEKLDAWVKKYVNDTGITLGDEVLTLAHPGEPEYQPQVPENKALNDLIKENNWKTIDTVGDGTCLLHALLTSLSPTYRRIPFDKRGEVGRAYRTQEFIKLFESTKDKDFVNSNEFLEDTPHLRRFSDVFKYNIFVIQRRESKQSYTFSFDRIHPGQVGAAQLPTTSKADWLFLFNTMDGHFSSIQVGTTFSLSNDDFQKTYGNDIQDVAALDQQWVELRNKLINELSAFTTGKNVKSNEIRAQIQTLAFDEAGLKALKPMIDAYIEMLGIEEADKTRILTLIQEDKLPKLPTKPSSGGARRKASNRTSKRSTYKLIKRTRRKRSHKSK
jgi:hypothetical protein